MRLIEQYKQRLEQTLDAHFPKDRKTNKRGEALVLFAETMLIIREVLKAFGGCEKCYGKGYSTQMYGLHNSSDFSTECSDEAPSVHMNFCSCGRGIQLKNEVEKLFELQGTIE